jgi:hypothetical protein
MKLLGGRNTRGQTQQEELDEIFKTPKPPSRFGRAIRMVLTFVIISLLALTILVLYIRNAISSIEPANVSPSISGQVSASFSLLSKGALQYNDSKSIVDFARLHYSIYNSTNTTAIMTVYASNPIRRIYLLNIEDYCVDCFVGSSLYTGLNSSLRKYGLIFNQSSFNYVDINKIDSIPKGSIIIIPSGLMPDILLPNVTYTNLCPRYTNSTILSLLGEGDIIMYVGRNFSRSVSCSGQTVQTSAQTLATLSSELNTTGASLNYTANVLYLPNVTFAFNRGESYGTAGAVNVGRNGSFVVLSNYPSVGWSDNYVLLSADIAKVLASRFWIPFIANGTATINGSAHVSSNLTIFTTNLTIPNGPGITDTVNNSYPIVKVMANNSGSFAQYDIPVHITFKNNGIISMPASVGLGAQAQLEGQIYNSSNRVVIAYAQIYNSNLTPINNLQVHFGQMGPTAVYVFSSFALQSGYYIANLTDQNGNEYSSALFYVASANVTPTSLDFKNGSFWFNVESNGAPASGIPYTINLNGAYNSTGYVDNGALHYLLPQGTAVGYGSKEFTIKLLGNTYGLSYPYNNPGLNIPPLYIEVAIEAIIVIIITKVLVPPNVDEYYIDVPDIRPIQKQVLKESSDAMVDVFNKVNSYYHWKDMPLSVDEVKTGISNNIKYGNTKISVTARNALSALNKLVSKGVVEEAGDYYALRKWIDESGHSIDYLVVYRKLRDYCVANAMLFTELDSGSDMDMIITNKSTKNYIKIYSDDMRVKDIEIKQGARVFIAFLNEEKKQLFLDKLYTSYGKSAEMLKMAISYGNIRLIDTDQLEVLKL